MNNNSLSVRLRILALPVLLAVGLFLFLSQPSSAFALDGEGAGEQVQSSDQTQLQDLDAPVPGATVPDPEEGPVFEEDQGPTGGSVEDQSDVRAYDDGRSHYLGDGQDDGQDDNQDQGQQPLADGIYRIASSAATSMTIDITNGSVDAGANVRTWTWNTTEAQCFQLVYDVASASYAILSAKSGLPISAASDTKGGNIYQGQASDPDLQRWYILPTATPGRYTISSASGSYAWDIANGSTAKGANIRLWTPNGTAAQTWIVTLALDLADAEVSLPGGDTYPYVNGPVTPEVTVTWQGKELMAGVDYTVSCTSNALPGTASLTVKPAPGAGSTGSLAGPSFQITPPQGALFDPAGTYRISTAASTSLSADIANGSVDAGANLRTWTWNRSEAQQYLIIYDAETGTYTILSAKSGLPLAAVSDTKGANVFQDAEDGAGLQRWYILPTATPGRYTIASVSFSYAWDIANGSTAKGANIRLWTPNGTAAQTWIITQVLDLADAQVQLVEEGPFPYADGSPVTPAVTVTWQGKELTAGADYIVSYASNVLPGTVTLTVKAAPGAGSTGSLAGPSFRISGPTTPSIADGTYGVASKKHMARVMDVAGGSVASGANLQSYRWNQSEAQRYIFTFHEDGCYYTIISAKSGKALTLQSADPKANVFQADLEEGNVLQQWYVLKSGDYFIIESVAGAVVLDIANGSTSSGANIRGYGFNDTDAQKWELFDPDSKAVRVAASKAMNQAVQKILDSGGWSLWNAFNYIAHHYVWRWWYLYPSGDWMESYAWHIYSTGGGNCYCYAALFTYCAWALGYTSMTAVSGLCTGLGGWTPHGWAQMNGKIYDADLYYESGFSRNGYAITNGSYLSYRYL